MQAKYIHLTLGIASTLVVVIFIALIVTLLEQNTVSFTNSTDSELAIHQTDPIIGSNNPDVILVYFGNFHCNTCASLAVPLRDILNEFGSQITLVWKDFPNETQHEESIRASIAARCAQKQDAFWNYADLLLANQAELGDDLYLAAAEDLDLRMGAFKRCLKNEKTRDLVEASGQEALDLELIAAPTIYVGQKQYSGKMTGFELRNAIQQALEN